MIKLFKSNIPLAYIFSILFILIVGTEVFLTDSNLRYTFFDWYDSTMKLVNNSRVIDYALTIIFILTTGYVINRAFNKASFYLKTTAFPMFVFIIILSTFGGFYFKTTYIVDLVFALAFLKLIELDQNKSAIHIGFISGFFLGIGFLFSYWCIPVGLLIFFSLNTFRPFQWREWLVSIIGMAIPFVYLLSIRYLYTGAFAVKPNLLGALLNQDYWFDHVSYVLITLVVIIAMFKLRKQSTYISNIERKQVNILAFYTVITFMLSAGIYWVYKIEYIIFIVPLTLLISVPIINTKRDGLLNVLLGALLIFNLLRIFFF